ncbi:MAG TPA: hypothetical protein VKZ51_12555, partial [Cyclobacteriaceae bacterium]|nr:hypothetical protein [Cyclobacteriaceae bacterium]
MNWQKYLRSGVIGSDLRKIYFNYQRGRNRCRTLALMTAYAFIVPIFWSISQSIEEQVYQQDEVFIHQAKGSA